MEIIGGIIRVVGVVVFMYLVWRKNREDYQSEEIVGYLWLTLLTFVAAARIGFGLQNWGIWNENWVDWLTAWDKPGMNYLMGYGGVVLLTYLYGRSREWKVLAFLEDISMDLVVWMLITMMGEVVASRLDWTAIWAVLSLVLTGVVAFWLTKRYRSFGWYKSGKKGFVFLGANVVFCLLWLLIGFSFVGIGWAKVVFVIWGLTCLIGLILLGDTIESLKINRGRKK